MFIDFIHEGLDFKLLSPGCVVIASGSLVKALAVIVSAEVCKKCCRQIAARQSLIYGRV